MPQVTPQQMKRRVHPDYPPRARLERFLASARLVLAVGAVCAVWFNLLTPSVNLLVAGYVENSFVVLALV